MRAGRLLAAALLLVAAAARSQPAPDVPSGDATLRGRLLHEQRPDATAGLEVILYSLDPEGSPGLRRTTTGEDGRFAFEGISNDPSVVYLVGTRLAGIPFGTRVSFAADQSERSVEIPLSDPSTDAGRIALPDARLRLERGCTHLRIHHTHTLESPDDRVVFVPPGQREGAEALLEVRLPEGASEIETPLGTGDESYDRDGRVLRFWGPLYPGEQEIEFGYGVPIAPDLRLAVGLPDGIGDVAVLVPAEGLELTGEGLEPAGEQTLAGRDHRVLRRGGDGAGALTLRVAVPASGAEGVRIGQSRLWLELDDAALEVSEQHQIEVGEQAPADDTGAPLLCVDLPEGARDVLFGGSATGVSRDPSGAIALRGPLPVGESSLGLRYRLPVASEPYRFEREFASGVELLSVLVADTGVVPETTRLHRRRPVRTEDRSYLHLEGFGIEPGERVEIRFERLPPRRGLSGLAFGGLVFAGALGSVFFLAAPLRRGADVAEEEVAPERSTARQALYQAIEALDEDFETGKLSAEDHARMRAELRARAVVLLRQEREEAATREAAAAAGPEPSRPQAAATAAARFCTQCGAPVRAEDRFCARCGARIAPPPEPPRP